MKLNKLVQKLNKLIEQNPELADKHVFLWSEHDENFIGFNDLLKYKKKGFIEKGQAGTSRLGEEEVFFSVKEYNDMFDEKFKKEDLEQVVLL